MPYRSTHSGLTHEVANDPTLTPEQREAAKSAERKGEDISYTLNHTITCLGFDLGWSPASYYVRKGIHHVVPSIAGPASPHGPRFAEQMKSYWTGELIGDLGAVPVAIGMQRYAPGIMEGINGKMETLLGPMYRRGAEKTAREWAEKHGYAADSPECHAKADIVYHESISHLAQGGIWTVASFPLNIAAQVMLTKEHDSIPGIVGTKVGSSLLAAGAVLGGRALLPAMAHDWDKFTSRHLFAPAIRAVDHLRGVETKPEWRKRVRDNASAPDAALSAGR